MVFTLELAWGPAMVHILLRFVCIVLESLNQGWSVNGRLSLVQIKCGILACYSGVVGTLIIHFQGE